ncbi:hypothetical protein T484DRAFT_1634785, partial [Baffinella frigidus]
PHPQPQTSNPQPQTPHPKPQTPNPKPQPPSPQTPNPKPRNKVRARTLPRRDVRHLQQGRAQQTWWRGQPSSSSLLRV